MERRPLGATGLTVSRIGLGLAALGRPAYINLGHEHDLGNDRSVEAVERHTHEVLDAAWDAGIRYVDAARSYGRAEEILGSWLHERDIPAGAIVVGSKWGYRYVGDWRVDAEVHEVKDHSASALAAQWAESRALLGTHLALYQVHSATLETGVLSDRAVLEFLAGLRTEQGVLVGITTTGPRQADTLRAAMAAEVDGFAPFACVQATWNVFEPSVGPALAEAHDAGWGVIVKEGVANGRLTDRERDPGILERRAPLDRLAEEHGVGVDAIALAVALAQPWADVVLSGAATLEQLLSNIAALALEPATAEVDLRPTAMDPTAYWQLRSELHWT
jgi:aryl-alcohol dehydrogenase-like predicted oxidoreductase